MRRMTIQALSFATLLASALLAGCDGSNQGVGGSEDNNCEDGNGCMHVYTCWDGYLADEGDPAPLVLCNGKNINSLTQGFRQTCQSDDVVANDFCKAECVKAAQQNGRPAAEIQVLCQYAQASADVDDQASFNSCLDNMEEINKAEDYGPSICEPDMPHIYCHGTAEPSKPPSVDPYDFDENRLSYWTETWEGNEWHYTAAMVPYDSSCGYFVTNLDAPGTVEAENQRCRDWCYESIDSLDGASLDQEGYDDAVQITRHNCESFVSGSFCAAPTASPLVGPLSVPLTLAATLYAGTTSAPVSTTFMGLIDYSAYDCAPGTASCPILIHSLSLDMNGPLSGQWLGATGGSTPFSAQRLSVTLERPISGRITNQGEGFALRAGSMPLHVQGGITLGTTATSQRIELTTYNADEIAGTIASDGTLGVSGTFSLAPGMTVVFGTPAPQ